MSNCWVRGKLRDTPKAFSRRAFQSLWGREEKETRKARIETWGLSMRRDNRRGNSVNKTENGRRMRKEWEVCHVILAIRRIPIQSVPIILLCIFYDAKNYIFNRNDSYTQRHKLTPLCPLLPMSAYSPQTFKYTFEIEQVLSTVTVYTLSNTNSLWTCILMKSSLNTSVFLKQKNFQNFHQKIQKIRVFINRAHKYEFSNKLA